MTSFLCTYMHVCASTIVRHECCFCQIEYYIYEPARLPRRTVVSAHEFGPCDRHSGLAEDFYLVSDCRMCFADGCVIERNSRGAELKGVPRVYQPDFCLILKDAQTGRKCRFSVTRFAGKPSTAQHLLDFILFYHLLSSEALN
uniref:Secreted protein n=1 Tax=Ascaris lumbricoides TaxID=6252 RepID=A0A0M3IKV4_ASCLU